MNGVPDGRRRSCESALACVLCSPKPSPTTSLLRSDYVHSVYPSSLPHREPFLRPPSRHLAVKRIEIELCHSSRSSAAEFDWLLAHASTGYPSFNRINMQPVTKKARYNQRKEMLSGRAYTLIKSQEHFTMRQPAIALLISLFSCHFYFSLVSSTALSIERWNSFQSQRDLVSLAEKWNLTDNGFEYESLSFKLGYVTSDFVLNSMMSAELYDTNCKEGGVPVPSEELSYTVLQDDTIAGVGENPRIISVQIDINSAAISDSITYSETTNRVGELQATVQFCMRMGLFTNSEPAIEVNFLETIVILYIDLTDGFAIDNISVTPRDQLVQTANQAYQVEGFLCDFKNRELSDSEKAAARNQGSLLRVCVRPDEEARGDSVFMRSIDNFTWQRDFGGAIGIQNQEAVVDREPALNGLTTLECVSGSEVCAFESILFAAMFRTPGLVTGSGVASMQFGTETITNTRRELRSLQDRGDEGAAAQAEFDFDMEVVPVRNPYLNYGDDSSSSALSFRFLVTVCTFAATFLVL